MLYTYQNETQQTVCTFSGKVTFGKWKTGKWLILCKKREALGIVGSCWDGMQLCPIAVKAIQFLPLCWETGVWKNNNLEEDIDWVCDVVMVVVVVCMCVCVCACGCAHLDFRFWERLCLHINETTSTWLCSMVEQGAGTGWFSRVKQVATSEGHPVLTVSVPL